MGATLEWVLGTTLMYMGLLDGPKKRGLSTDSATDHVLLQIINFILTHTKVIRLGDGQNFNHLIRQT